MTRLAGTSPPSRTSDGPVDPARTGVPRRSTVLVATAAVLVALWLGLTAPAGSPVVGVLPAQQAAPAAVIQDMARAAPDRPLVPGVGRGGSDRW